MDASVSDSTHVEVSSVGEEASPAPDAARVIPGEILVGFEGTVAGAFRNHGADVALEAAGRLVGPFGLSSGRVLFEVPATNDHPARLVTHWRLPAGADVRSVVARLTGREGIAYAEPNGIMTIATDGDPSDPGDPSFQDPAGWPFGIQEHLVYDGATSSNIDVERAWDLSTGGAVDADGNPWPGGSANSQVIVAVVDTGVDLDHPDLDGNLLRDGSGAIVAATFTSGDGSRTAGGVTAEAKGGIPGPPPNGGGGGGGGGSIAGQDDNGHGTHVAGIIAAEINNMTDLAAEAAGNNAWTGGTVGVAPQAEIMPVKVLGSGGGGSFADVAAGIAFAANPDGDPTTTDGADIISMSLGGGFSQAVSDAIAFAHSQGVLVISAAGNGNFEGSSHPASDLYSLSIAAVDSGDVRAGFSNYGFSVDVAAPGVSILSTFIDVDDAGESGSFTGAYGRISGTSMATPGASGVAALIKSIHPTWTPEQVAAQLLATADNIDALQDPRFAGKLGAGRINAWGAVGAQVTAPLVIAAGGLGADGGTINRLEPGSLISVQFSHVMDAASVLDINQYQLLYLGADSTVGGGDDALVSLEMATATYDAFPGRGVRLRVAEAAPDGNYQFTVNDTLVAGDGTTALDGDRNGTAGGNYVRTFSVVPPTISTGVVRPFGAMTYQGSVSDRLESTLSAFIPTGSGGLRTTGEMVFGPDGKLYVSSVGTDEVLRYNADGSFDQVFASGGGLGGPRGLVFADMDGATGDELIVAGSFSDGVYVYQGPNGTQPGQFIQQLDADGTGGLGFPTGLDIGPDGRLYVSSNATGEVLVYDSAADNFATFVSSTTGLSSPQGLRWHNNELFVAEYSKGDVLQFDTGGNLLGVFASGGINGALGIAFGDTDGTPGDELHVASVNTDEVLRYDSSGAFIDAYVQENDGGLDGPVGVIVHGDANGDGMQDLYAGGWYSSNVLRFDGITRGALALADSDGFTLALDAGQAATVQVTSTAEVTVTLSYVDGTGSPVTLSTLVDADPGPGVLYQTVRTSGGDPLPDGTLTITVQGPDQLTSRRYEVGVTLNALLEVEDNSTTPQSLDSSIINLSPAGLPAVARGAVLGTIEKAVQPILQESETGSQTDGFLFPNEDLRASWDQTGAITWAINGGGNALSPLNKGVVGSIKVVDVFSPQYDGYDTYRFDAHAGDVVSVRSWGKNSGGGTLARGLVDLHDSTTAQLVVGAQVAGAPSDFQITDFTIPADGSYFIHVYSDKKVQGTYTLTVDMTSTSGPPVPDSLDRYSFNVPVDGRVSLTSDAPVTLAVFDDMDNPVDLANPLTAGSYAVEVTAPDIAGDSIAYGLVLGIDGALDHGPNNDQAAAQDLTGFQGAFGHVGGTTVGYYTDGYSSTTAPEAAIVKAGSIPVHIDDISTFDLSTIDVLMVDESSNGGLSTPMSGRLGDIQAWVTAGGVFIVHDRFVTDDTGDPQSNPFLVGRPDILLDRDFTDGADIDVIDDTTFVTHGPGGVVDNTTLDGGNYSNHGFAVASTLSAAGDKSILSAGPDPSKAAAFSYDLGGGAVYYSTIPLDFYLGFSNNFNDIYTPNAVANANSLTQPDEDWYSVTVTGASKVFETRTPADGTGEFFNILDPHLELYDSGGQLVATGTPLADGRNEQIMVSVGNYSIRVTAEGGTFGEYVLIDPPAEPAAAGHTHEDVQTLSTSSTAGTPALDGITFNRPGTQTISPAVPQLLQQLLENVRDAEGAGAEFASSVVFADAGRGPGGPAPDGGRLAGGTATEEPPGWLVDAAVLRSEITPAPAGRDTAGSDSQASSPENASVSDIFRGLRDEDVTHIDRLFADFSDELLGELLAV